MKDYFQKWFKHFYADLAIFNELYSIVKNTHNHLLKTLYAKYRLINNTKILGKFGFLWYHNLR